VQRHAEQLLDLSEHHDAGRQDVRTRSVDAEPAHDRALGLLLDEVQGLRKLIRAEVRADEPARRARAAADAERSVDTGRPKVRERRGRLHVRLGERVDARRQANRAEVDRLQPVGAGLRRADRDLRRRAADVAHRDPLRQLDGRRGHRTAVREPALFLRREHPHRHAGRRRQRCDEVGRVRALPARRGEEDVERLDRVQSRTIRELPNRLRGRDDMKIRDGAEALDLLAERQTHLVLVDHDDLAALDPRDEQASRVRTDIENPNRHRHPS
jgi:hypothetical protein